MKRLIFICIVLIAVMSCQKDQSADSGTSPVAAESTKPDSNVLQVSDIEATSAEPVELSRTYIGDNLTLVSQNDGARTGQIKLIGADAEALYQALWLNALPATANAVFSDIKKIGSHLLCEEMSMASRPQNKIHTCTFNINYELGSVTALSAPTSEPPAAAPEDAYEGEVLRLMVANSTLQGGVILKPEDSKVLYFALNAIEVEKPATETYKSINRKLGQNIKCLHAITRSSPEKSEFSCAINISNAQTGVVETLNPIEN